MPFLIKIFLSTVFGDTEKFNLGAKLFAPKSGNHSHFWAALGSDSILSLLNHVTYFLLVCA